MINLTLISGQQIINCIRKINIAVACKKFEINHKCVSHFVVNSAFDRGALSSRFVGS